MFRRTSIILILLGLPRLAWSATPEPVGHTQSEPCTRSVMFTAHPGGTIRTDSMIPVPAAPASAQTGPTRVFNVDQLAWMVDADEFAGPLARGLLDDRTVAYVAAASGGVGILASLGGLGLMLAGPRYRDPAIGLAFGGLAVGIAGLITAAVFIPGKRSAENVVNHWNRGNPNKPIRWQP